MRPLRHAGQRALRRLSKERKLNLERKKAEQPPLPGTYSKCEEALRQASTYDDVDDPFDWRGVRFPMAPEDWDTFEANNPGYVVDVHVYRADPQALRGYVVGPWRIHGTRRRFEEGVKHVDILLFGQRNENEDDDNNHYVWCKNLSTLLRHNDSDKGVRKRKCCPFCYQSVQQRDYTQHVETHIKKQDHPCHEILPEPEDRFLRFGKRPLKRGLQYKKTLRLPFAFYIDFESMLVPVAATDENQTHATHRHVPASCMVVEVGPDGRVVSHDTFKAASGGSDAQARSDVVTQVLRYLTQRNAEIHQLLTKGAKKLVWRGDEQRHEHKRSTVCHICDNAEHQGFQVLTPEERVAVNAYFTAKHENAGRFKREDYLATLEPAARAVAEAALEKDKWRLVADHDHMKATDNYRGPAHNQCNREFTVKKQKTPVFCHNFKRYDQHLLLYDAEPILVCDKTGANLDSIGCIALNGEKYLAVTHNYLEFKDSYQFMSSSLETIARDMRCGQEGACEADNIRANFPRTIEYFTALLAERGVADPDAVWKCIDLITQKGVFPYTSFDSMAFFKRDRLPPIEEFHNDLSDEPCSPADYARAQRVWDAFGCRTCEDYHDLYLAADTFILADAMESLRAMYHKAYGLDPAWFYGLPGLSMDAALRAIGKDTPPEVLTDVEMLHFCEDAKRGGITNLTQNYAEANNKHLSTYDPSKPSSYIVYKDANNLYGWAMSQLLPHSNFRWETRMSKYATEAKIKAALAAWSDTDATGGMIEFDAHVPVDFHDLMADYPPMAEIKAVPQEALSATSLDGLRRADGKVHYDVGVAMWLCPK